MYNRDFKVNYLSKAGFQFKGFLFVCLSDSPHPTWYTSEQKQTQICSFSVILKGITFLVT